MPCLVIPSRHDAQRLVDNFICTMGNSYHFLDQRLFLDHLASLYQLPITLKSFDTIWHIKFLLVLALGMLFSNELVQETNPPGINYYLKARDLLPNTSTLSSIRGTEGVEVLCLMSLYLQCCDQMEDAYIYVSACNLNQYLSKNANCNGKDIRLEWLCDLQYRITFAMKN